MKTVLLVGLSACLGFLYGCRQEVSPVRPDADINQLISAQTRLPDVAPNAVVLLSDDPAYPQLVNGSGYIARKRTFRQTRRFEDHLNATGFDQTDPNSDQGLYVGSVVRLKAFAQRGDLTSIGVVDRAPITLSSNLPGAVPKAIQPSKANYQTAMTQWLQHPTSAVADISYDATVMNSTEQALLSQGVNIGWGPAKVASQFDVATDVQQQDIIVAFKQVYHKVTMEYLGSGANYFTASVDIATLRASAPSDDPLGYVSEITYGRLLLARLRFKTSVTTDKQQLSASLATSLRTGVTISTELKTILTEASVKLTILGGDAISAANVLNTTNGLVAIESINRWIKDGANSPAKGAPLSYRMRYLSDNGVVALGASTEYADLSNWHLARPSTFSITKLTITKLPTLDPSGGFWDNGLAGLPDVFFTITDAKGTNLYGLDPVKRKENASDEEVRQGLIGWSLTDANAWYSVGTPIKVLVWDYDTVGSNEFMGEVSFNAAGVYPQKQVELVSTDGKMKIVFDLEWQ